MLLNRLISAAGLLCMVATAWALSENRRGVRLRPILWGLALQVLLGAALLHTPLKDVIFAGMDKVIGGLTSSTLAGAETVFGKLADQEESGFILAFQGLTVIIFVSAIAAMLYHLRVIQAVVRGVAWLMRRTMKTSGAETFAAALLIFLGIESMTAVRGYLGRMTRSELCTIMTTFMATIAGSVMVLYASPAIGAPAGHLLIASLMSAPAAILISKTMTPETERPATGTEERIRVEVESHNVIDAAARGTGEGLQLALNVAAMVLVFVGLVHLFDLALGGLTKGAVEGGVSLAQIMGWVFRPVAFLLGVPWDDAGDVGHLLGTKTVLNEFVAYLELKPLRDVLAPRSVTIATYALCGFANPGSLGIVIAGVSSLVPERRVEVTALGIKAFVGGTLACFMTACMAGMLVAN